MLAFVVRRLGVMLLTMFCLTLVVFFLINLEPNLKKLAISQTDSGRPRAAGKLASAQWLPAELLRPLWPVAGRRQEAADHRSYNRRAGAALPLLRRASRARPIRPILQGDFGCSTKFRTTVAAKLFPALGATGILMFWVMATMVPIALLIGILAGMREGSRTDRTLSIASIATTATPEYVSGVIFAVIFASWLGWLNGSAASATGTGITFYNFSLPVMTMAIYGIGYIARMTRASMVEVMTQQYIRTARLKGLSFGWWWSSTRCATR